MLLEEINTIDVYEILDESVLNAIKRVIKSGVMKIQTLHISVTDISVKVLEKILKGIDGVNIVEKNGKIDVVVSVEKEAQFKTILYKIRQSNGNIVSIKK